MLHESNGEKVFNTLNIILMVVAVLLVMLPLFSVISTSLVSSQEIARRPFIIFPEDVDWSAYRTLFEGGSVIISGYKITLFRIVVGTSLNLLFSYFTAYAMAKRGLPGKNMITFFFFFTILFNGGLIPYYLVVKYTGLINSIWVYVIPGLISVWYTLLIRNFIMNIPESMTEAAEMDGANDIHLIFLIILPLSVPALVTIGLFYAVAHWNSWWDAYLFMSDRDKHPIQLVLRNILVLSQLRMADLGNEDIAVKPPSRAIQNAAVMVTTIPIVLIYPFIQKYFIKGIMIGAIKG